MPAVSDKQQRWAAGCLHNPKHMRGGCPDEGTAREFAETPQAGLPERVRQDKRRNSYRRKR